MKIKPIQLFKAAKSKVSDASLVLAVSAMSTAFSIAQAQGLPTPPTVGGVNTATQADSMTVMRDLAGSGIGLAMLVISSLGFLTVSVAGFSKFNDWRKGKAELGDLKVILIVGALLLAVMLYFGNQAVGVIGTAGTFSGTNP
jgi:integrating conjugative element membrane protein (TIGR03745 family)